MCRRKEARGGSSQRKHGSIHPPTTARYDFDRCSPALQWAKHVSHSLAFSSLSVGNECTSVPNLCPICADLKMYTIAGQIISSDGVSVGDYRFLANQGSADDASFIGNVQPCGDDCGVDFSFTDDATG